MRETNFGELLGFEKKLITKTEYGTKLPNITNSIDILNINTNAIKDSIVDGVNTNTIAMIPTDNLTRSYPFTFEPRRTLTHRRNAANNGDEAGLMLGDVNVNFNKGFAARKTLLALSAEVNCEFPLNRYSFFEALEDKLLPDTKIDLSIEFDDDKNLIWRQGAADAAGTSYRLIIRRLQLFVPRLVFNSEGQKLYMEDYLKPYKWTYLKETVFTSNLSKQNAGHFRITNGISKPRHVFVFFINNANINNQLQNSFLYNTFSASTNPRTVTRCHLEVENGNEYPRIHYKPTENESRVFRDVMSYVYANNDYQGGTLLNISNFKTLYPFVYFDLTKKKMDIKD